VKCFELGAVADADNGCIGETLQQEPHHLLLPLRIERGSRFIHDDRFRTLDEYTRKGEPLFLSAGQDVLPRGRIFVEPIEKMAQPYFPGRPADHRVVNLVG
jgi:hypothetical protein